MSLLHTDEHKNILHQQKSCKKGKELKRRRQTRYNPTACELILYCVLKMVKLLPHYHTSTKYKEKLVEITCNKAQFHTRHYRTP